MTSISATAPRGTPGGTLRVCRPRRLPLAALLLLGACMMPAPSTDAGCRTYREQRRDMPDLLGDPLSRWVAITDSAMTGACT